MVVLAGGNLKLYFIIYEFTLIVLNSFYVDGVDVQVFVDIFHLVIVILVIEYPDHDLIHLI